MIAFGCSFYMQPSSNFHNRRSLRLQGYDYGSYGSYFLTLCTKNRESLFGNISKGQMNLNRTGQIILSAWKELPNRFPKIELDEFVIMPNHVHGIIWIKGGETPPLRETILGQIVGFYKYQSTKQINLLHHRYGQPIWQRNYYERIIRDENELFHIRYYIQKNPENWEKDIDNTHAS